MGWGGGGKLKVKKVSKDHYFSGIVGKGQVVAR